MPNAPQPKPQPSKAAKQPSNSKSMAEWNLEQLKKTAISRGIPLEKLVAQMVEQYLKEDKKE